MKCVPASQGKQILLEVHARIYGHHVAEEEVSGRKNLSPRFLLAHRAKRCRGGHPQVRRMSVLRSANPFTGAGAPNHPNHLAFRGLGSRHGGTPQEGPGRLHSPTCSSRQVYQVDRGQAHHQHPLGRSGQILTRHHLPVRRPNCIITDHGTNFTRKKFLDFSDGYGIRIDWASIGHPRTNGQVECANGMVLQGLKSRIFDQLNKHAGRWVAEVPVIL